ncbi:11214_t:CDS:2 [Ambispora gerdemannii]|uniref:11214_t:CDS:1 n=1 Tax=Ambispora gerdemannii TaxID=144530 RepID=A0A9N8YVB2_9GLOM|nr:11214_t:CDS:2 [Ambispora gerdemannii]
MELQGSCHCEKVKFKVKSNTPVPFMYCYCSICRKLAGGGGYSINIMDSLEVQGMEYVKIYRGIHEKNVPKEQQDECGNRRHFCGECSAMLWAYDPQWSQWCYPFASAIDTELPVAKRPVCIMLKYKAKWAPVPTEADAFDEYPDKSIEDWHKHNKLWQE